MWATGGEMCGGVGPNGSCWYEDLSINTTTLEKGCGTVSLSKDKVVLSFDKTASSLVSRGNSSQRKGSWTSQGPDLGKAVYSLRQTLYNNTGMLLLFQYTNIYNGAKVFGGFWEPSTNQGNGTKLYW